jgi:hypothetical protein
MRRRRLLVAGAAALALPVAALGAPAAADDPFAAESRRLSEGLAAAMTSAGFDRLVDYNDVVDGLAQPQRHLPQVDVAVIEMDQQGDVVGAANVLYGRDQPEGLEVPLTRDLAQHGVRFSEWNLTRFDDPGGEWGAGPAPEEVLSAPDGWTQDWLAPYPASVLKLMVAYSVLRAVDDGVIRLDQKVAYQKVRGQGCGAAASRPRGFTPKPKTQGSVSVRSWLDQMITVSDNFATCVLLQQLFDRGRLAESNQHFADLGLSTLRMWPASPERGTGWLSGTMTMGALDTARLLLVVSGARGSASGELWTAPDGSPVTSGELSASSRTLLLRLLGEQSFNEVLSTVNLCGSPDAVSGIPSTVPQRWVDPATRHVVTYDGDLVIDFGYDTAPCHEAAEVDFAHKTGLISVAGADAGIVRALPGQDGRWYVVAVQSSVGFRFGDAANAASSPNACEDAPFVCYPTPLGRLGAAVDEAVATAP